MIPQHRLNKALYARYISLVHNLRTRLFSTKSRTRLIYRMSGLGHMSLKRGNHAWQRPRLHNNPNSTESLEATRSALYHYNVDIWPRHIYGIHVYWFLNELCVRNMIWNNMYPFPNLTDYDITFMSRQYYLIQSSLYPIWLAICRYPYSPRLYSQYLHPPNLN